MSATSATGILLGRGRRSLGAVLLVSVGLGLTAFVGSSVVRQLTSDATPMLNELFYPLFLTDNHPVFAVAVVGGWIALSGVASYRQGGLLAGWTILFGPLFGGLANIFVARNLCCTSATTSPAILRATYLPYAYVTNSILAIVAALAYALVLGTVGYVLAKGAKTVHRRYSPDASKT